MARRSRDAYPTPHSIIRVMLHRVELDDVVWEPCAGDGRLVDAMRSRTAEVIAGDIITGEDFFAVEAAPAKMLVTNPPFGCIRKFIDHAFDIGVQRLVLVCPERLWACQKGHDQWRRHRPSVWANLDWREDYLGKGGAPDRALAVGIWDSPLAFECRYEVWGPTTPWWT